jgi:NAD(P)-dependent dehydrogenase (short-subunit alcohol dehydrogenase family)
MNLSFENKVALVTGAASGMGLATAEAFGTAGAAVALADLNQAEVRKVAERLKNAGHKVLAIACDVTDEVQVRNMVEQTVSGFGRLDAAFNNAGVQSPPVETADTTSEEFERVNAVNLKSVWLCMKYELRPDAQAG